LRQIPSESVGSPGYRPRMARVSAHTPPREPMPREGHSIEHDAQRGAQKPWEGGHEEGYLGMFLSGAGMCTRSRAGFPGHPRADQGGEPDNQAVAGSARARLTAITHRPGRLLTIPSL